MLNSAQVIGRLGQDPDFRALPNGDSVTILRIATTEKWTDKSTGEIKEATEWHRCSLFGRLAEIAAQYLNKGSLVYVSGKIVTRKYTDKEGIERYTTEIRCNELKMLGSKDGGKPTGSVQRPRQQNHREPSYDYPPDISDLAEDIPF